MIIKREQHLYFIFINLVRRTHGVEDLGVLLSLIDVGSAYVDILFFLFLEER